MSNQSGWEHDGAQPWLDVHPNYLNVRSRQAAQAQQPRTFNRWLVATAAHVVGVVVAMGAGFVLGFLGILLAFAIGVSGSGSAVHAAYAITAIVMLMAIGAGVLATAWLVRHLGGRTALLGAVASTATSWAAGHVLLPLGLPYVAHVIATHVVALVVLALIIQPRP